VRPINLIPDEERRRSSGVATRTGPVVYLLVGALGVLLIGVIMLVLFTNSIHDREGEVTRLESEKAVATAQASKLAGYTSFKQVAEGRTRTISELADSRFDWVRVIRQLSLVLPKDVYFEGLKASAGGGSEAGVAGPSLTVIGCGAGQGAVAGFVASLREIDGVTRVQLSQSTLNKGEGAGKEGSSEGGGSPCSKPGMAQFEIIVAFDAAPPSPDSATGMAEAGESESSTEGEGSTEEEGSTESESEGSAESEGTTESNGGVVTEGGASQSAAVPSPGAAG
jgi:Tfp pilus assembly protein PilN